MTSLGDNFTHLLTINDKYHLTQPMDPEKKSLNFIFPTKYVIPKSLKFSHWLSESQFVKVKSTFLWI